MDDYLNITTWAVNAVAAVNWGLQEYTSTNLLTDTLSLDPGTAGILYGLIGVSGVLAIYQLVDAEVMED